MYKVKTDAKKTVKLYDFGFGLIFIFAFGVLFGFVLDYIWNRVVLWLTLRYLIKPPVHALAFEKIGTYAFFITIVGMLIDWGYHVLIWDLQDIGGGITRWVSTSSPGGQLALILPVILLLLLANLALAIKYLEIERRPALITSGVMAVFTAPWLLTIIPRAAGWTGE